METSSNVPPPVKTWWYPGKSIGYEFIYPRAQAMQLAKVTTEPVLTTTQETSQFESADLSRISGSGRSGGGDGRGDAGAGGGGRPRAAGRGVRQHRAMLLAGAVASQDTRADERARATARTELPQTASNVPNLMLFGALALAIGFGLSRLRVRA